MKSLKNNDGYFIVPVPGDARFISLLNTHSMIDYFVGDVYKIIELPKKEKYELIGSLTPKHIDFDVEGFVEKDHGMLNNQYAFHSLIQASGYTYSNHYGEKEPPQKTYDALGRDLNIEWHNAQENVLQKGVIIKKI